MAGIRRWVRGRFTQAALYGLGFSILTPFVPQGPDLGKGIVFSLLASVCGWLAGTTLMDRLVLNHPADEHRSMTRALLTVRLIALGVVILLAASYFLWIRTKTSYSPAEISVFIIMVFLFGVASRCVLYSGAFAADPPIPRSPPPPSPETLSAPDIAAPDKTDDPGQKPPDG